MQQQRPRAQLAQLENTLSLQMNEHTIYTLKPLGAALRQKNCSKKNNSLHHPKKNIHKQLCNSLIDTPTEKAIHWSQSTSHTSAHLMQSRSEAYEAEDRCFVSQ